MKDKILKVMLPQNLKYSTQHRYSITSAPISNNKKRNYLILCEVHNVTLISVGKLFLINHCSDSVYTSNYHVLERRWIYITSA